MHSNYKLPLDRVQARLTRHSNPMGLQLGSVIARRVRRRFSLSPRQQIGQAISPLRMDLPNPHQGRLYQPAISPVHPRKFKAQKRAVDATGLPWLRWRKRRVLKDSRAAIFRVLSQADKGKTALLFCKRPCRSQQQLPPSFCNCLRVV